MCERVSGVRAACLRRACFRGLICSTSISFRATGAANTSHPFESRFLQAVAMALWTGLGQAATVAQLVGADVGGLISMIVQAALTA